MLDNARQTNKAIDRCRRELLACIACAKDRCNAIDTPSRNFVDNKLIGGPAIARCLKANVVHYTQNL